MKQLNNPEIIKEKKTKGSQCSVNGNNYEKKIHSVIYNLILNQLLNIRNSIFIQLLHNFQ